MVMAYQHTSMVSVQVLDCASIPTVIVLSVLLMRYRYGALHGVGVFTGLLGARRITSPLYVHVPQGTGSISNSNSKSDAFDSEEILR